MTSLWALSRSSRFCAHDNTYEGLDLLGIIISDGIKEKNDGYVDNVDTYTGEITNDIYVAHNVMTCVTTGAQKWANLCGVTAQSIAFHKYIVQTLSFTNVKSSLKIDYATQYDMSLQDSKGVTSTIKYLPQDKPNNCIGFRHAPYGN